MEKDNGRWNLYVGVGSEFFNRIIIAYDVSIKGNLRTNYIPSTEKAD